MILDRTDKNVRREFDIAELYSTAELEQAANDRQLGRIEKRFVENWTGEFLELLDEISPEKAEQTRRSLRRAWHDHKRQCLTELAEAGKLELDQLEAERWDGMS